MTKQVFITVGVLTVVGAIALSTWLMLPNGVTKDNFDAIQAGMSINEVYLQFRSFGKCGKGSEGVVSWTWTGDGNRVMIYFDQKTGKARDAYFESKDGVNLSRSPL